MEMIRILLVDEHPDFRQSASVYLRTVRDLEVVGVAGDEASAREVLAHETVDLVALGLGANARRGLDFARRLKAVPHPPRVLLLTTLPDLEGCRRLILGLGVDWLEDKADFAAVLPALARRLLEERSLAS